MRHRIEICTLLLTLIGCATPASKEVVVPTLTEHPGFPSPAHRGAVWIEASFVTNHESVLREDLIDEGLLPIWVKVGLQGEGGDAVRLVGDSVDPPLDLQAGTVLEWVRPEEVDTGSRRGNEGVAERALRLSLLEPWGQAEGGFLFFRLRADTRLWGTHALSSTRRYHRELDLLDSLLQLDVMTDDGKERLFVGLSRQHLRD